jgi:hypothetical protein
MPLPSSDGPFLTQERRAIFSPPMHLPATSSQLLYPSLPASPTVTRCNAHLHPQPARSPRRHQSSSHHFRPGVPLPSLRCHHVQCRMHGDLHKINCTITYQGRTIICGHKSTHTGLWMIPLRAHDSQAANPPGSIDHTPPTAAPTFANATNIDATSSTAEYARYIHQFMCSPPSATLLRALDRSEELTTIPGLTPALIKNHLSCSTATDKGHMHRHRSNTAST